MKVVVSLVLVLVLVCTATPPTYAEPHQVLQGTEIHLTLLTPISSNHSKVGDPFVAVLAQPVAFDSRIILPAGTRVNGIIGTIQKPKAFSIFRGQAYMSLTFKTFEVDSRLIPVQMSILAIGQPRVDSYSKPRKDMKITWPRAETPTHYITMGFSPDLKEATEHALRDMIDFLVSEKHLSRDDAYMLSSVAVDLDITQLVDGNVGVHAMCPKNIFTAGK